MNILRVFPYRTSYTPNDDMVFIGKPPFALMIPEHDEVHISCTFTWDRVQCRELADDWKCATDKPVRLGGVALKSPCEDFTPGLYVKQGITFTTRGCNGNCPFCVVPHVEGKLRELPIVPGNIIQDNNFLQASQKHKDAVCEMLSTQKTVQFKGGLQASLIDDNFIRAISKLRIDELWLACDTWQAIPTATAAIERLKAAGFSREKIKCYVLCGYDMREEDDRLRAVYNAGAMPFAQLYMDFGNTKTEYSREWKRFQRSWSRPAATRAMMEHKLDWRGGRNG